MPEPTARCDLCDAPALPTERRCAVHLAAHARADDPLVHRDPTPEELEDWEYEHLPALEDVLDGILGGLVLDPDRNG